MLFRSGPRSSRAARLNGTIPCACLFKELAIGDLPLYNQDDDTAQAAPVMRLKAEIRASDGVLFVTPEYNRSMPGVLKKSRAFDSRLRSLVQQGIEDRSIAPVDPALAVSWIMGATTLLPRWYHPSGRYGAEQVAKAYGDFARRMLAAGTVPAPDGPM